MLKGKTVVLGVTGSIAAYKIADLASKLSKLHCNVHVIMTRNATHFINPITFETLTNNKCLVDTFDRDFQYNVEHVSIAKKADLVLIAPATANVIAKIAHGLADDMLTTTVLACNCPKIVSPAMNTQMLHNPITQDNIGILRHYGFEIIEPATGVLACKDVGEGKLPDTDVLVDYILKTIAFEKDMEGMNVLVTAGPTQEAIDPVRYITNHSTGKMGYAIARNAMMRGANVTLVTGETSIQKPRFVKVIDVKSAADMFEAVSTHFDKQDVVIKAAAVADYTPANVCDDKMKKSDGDMAISLNRTKDILKYLGDNKRPNQFLCGFSMETKDMLENSRRKLIHKNLDMIVANNLKVEGAGFGVDTNVITMIMPGKEIALEMMSKDEVAEQILNEVLRQRAR